MQQPQRAVEARGATLRLQARGTLPPASGGEGREPRHRVVLDHRQRMAGAQGRIRALAQLRKFRCAGPPESELIVAQRERGVTALRRATRDDLPAVMALQRTAYAKNRAILGVEPLPLLADYEQVFSNYEVYLAERDGALDGVLVLEPRAADLLIWSVATAPVAQGRGVGNQMLAFAETRARALGLSCIRLYTGEKLTRNIAWYTRHGYAHESTEDMGDRVRVNLIKQL